MKVSYDFCETSNSFREFVCICEAGRVVKTRKYRCCCSCFFLENVEKKGIYWLDSSYAIDEFLQGKINRKNYVIACIMLELVDGTDKAFGFRWKGKKSHRLKNEERKKGEKKFIFVCRINGLWLCAFLEYKKNDSTTNLSR